MKFKLTRLIPFICCLGLITNFVFGSYKFLFHINFDLPHIEHNYQQLRYSRNFYTIGFPCICLGMWIRLKQKEIDIKRMIFICLLFLILLYSETYVVKAYNNQKITGDILLFTIPLAVSILVLSLNIKLKNDLIIVLSKMGKEHATNLFLFHMIVAICVDIFLYNLPFQIPYRTIWQLPLIILLTIIFSYLFQTVKRRLRTILIIPFKAIMRESTES